MKVDHSNGDVKPYGENIWLNEEDLYVDSDSDDLWDIWSIEEEGDSYSSDPFDENGVESFRQQDDNEYGLAWLTLECQQFATRKQGLDAEELQQQMLAMLASDLKDDELQMSLVDVIGYDDLDWVIDLISHRQEILAPKSLDSLPTKMYLIIFRPSTREKLLYEKLPPAQVGQVGSRSKAW